MKTTNKTLNLSEVSKQIETLNARYALGYEGNLVFNMGYIMALKDNKLVSNRDVRCLRTVYSNPENSDSRYTISSTGNLIDGQEELDFI